MGNRGKPQIGPVRIGDDVNFMEPLEVGELTDSFKFTEASAKVGQCRVEFPGGTNAGSAAYQQVIAEEVLKRPGSVVREQRA